MHHQPQPHDHSYRRSSHERPAVLHRPKTTIGVILGAVFLLAAGSALQGTAVSLRAGYENFPAQVIGVIMSVYFIGFAAGSMAVVRFIRYVGYVRTFAAFASLASATALAHLLMLHPAAWIVFRALYGFFIAGMLVIVESWLNASTSTYNRGKVLSLYSIVFLLAMGAGQPLLGVLPASGFELFAVTSILVSVSLVPLTLAQVTGTPQVERKPPRLLSTFAKAPLAGFGVIVSGMSAEAMWSIAPLFGQQSGFSEVSIGTFMLTISLGSLASQWPLGWISDRSDRRITILSSAAAAAAAAAVIALIPQAGFGLYLFTFLFGAFCMPLYSLNIALFNDSLNETEMVHAASALVVYYGLGSALGPYTASFVMSVTGPGGLFLFLGIVLGVFVIASLLRVAAVPLRIRQEKVHYHPYPRTTFAAFNLLRRYGHRRRRRRTAV